MDSFALLLSLGKVLSLPPHSTMLAIVLLTCSSSSSYLDFPDLGDRPVRIGVAIGDPVIFLPLPFNMLIYHVMV